MLIVSFRVVGVGGAPLGSYHLEVMPRIDDLIAIQRDGHGTFHVRVKDIHLSPKMDRLRPIRPIDDAIAVVTVETFKANSP